MHEGGPPLQANTPRTKIVMHFHSREHKILIYVKIDSMLGIEISVSIYDMAFRLGQSRSISADDTNSN